MKTMSKATNELSTEQANQRDCVHNCALGMLTRISARLVDLSSEDNIYQIIGEGLQELIPGSAILINSFDETSGFFYLKAILGIDKYNENLSKISGINVIGMSLAINDKVKRDLTNGVLKKIPSGMYDLAMGTISESSCPAIEKLLATSDIYAIGFTCKGKLLGSANIFLHRGSSSFNREMVKTFARLASLALQQRQIEKNMQGSEQKNKELLEKYNNVVQGSTDMIFTIDLEGRFLFTNQAMQEQLGYSGQELNKTNCFQLVHPDDLEQVKNKFISLINGKSINKLEYRCKRKEGSYVTILNSSCAIIDSNQKIIGVLTIARDISERKRIEEKLGEHRNNLEKQLSKRTRELELANKKLQRELSEHKRIEEEARQLADHLQNILRTAPVIIGRVDLKSKILHVNRKFEEVTGYSGDEVIGKYWPTLGLMQPESTGALINRMMDKLLGKSPSPMEVSIKCKDGQVKYITGVGEVIQDNSKPIGFLVMAQDITERKNAENKAIQSNVKLLKALEDIIQAMAKTVELRDPYIAGHQRRVAQLAYAIASDIGLPAEQLAGIRLAGLVHDIGKIQVPAEILTHPDGLTEAELKIVKMHPVVGFELLKGIEFPWPIAQVILQHHERLDGSGYPSGLLDKEIILEAKILAVADVVEAMASHRPYRPGLDIEVALEEISINSGKLFDSAIVDSCLRVFQQKDFHFETVHKEKIPSQQQRLVRAITN
jgi:PAS domain S-box-containing protein/putative nucleotidyltransferase with HDIG domain